MGFTLTSTSRPHAPPPPPPPLHLHIDDVPTDRTVVCAQHHTMRLAAASTVHVNPVVGGSFKCSKCVAGLESTAFYRCHECNYNVCLHCAAQADGSGSSSGGPPAAQRMDRDTGISSVGGSGGIGSGVPAAAIDVRMPIATTATAMGPPEVQGMTVGSGGGTLTAAGGGPSHTLSMASL